MKDNFNLMGSRMYNPFGDDIPVMFTPNKGGVYTAELYGGIDSPSQFSNIIAVMGMMGEEDVFNLHLQSYGGSVDAGDALLHAMAKCNGLVHVTATGGCHSMASAILVHADSFELSDGFSSLIHAGSTGMGADFQEFKQWSEFSVKATERSMRRIYAGMLTEAEIESVLDGKPIILDAEGWIDRHEKRNEYIRARMEAFQQEEQDALAAVEAAIEEASKPKPPKKPKQAKKDKPVEQFLEDAYDSPKPTTKEDLENAAILGDFIIR